MTKFNVGDKFIVNKVSRICGGRASYTDGEEYEVSRVQSNGGIFAIDDDGDVGVVILPHEFHAIKLVETNDPNRRLTEAEAKIAALEAEVKALKGSSKPERCGQTYAPSIDEMMRLGKSVSQSPNQRRADVIKRAQAFVADYGEVIGYGVTPLTKETGSIRIQFAVNAEKRTVAAIPHLANVGGVVKYAIAIAKCAPNDVFNADIGKAIALGRALGVKVPKEFTDAVKPTEVVVGMVVRYSDKRVSIVPSGQAAMWRTKGTATAGSTVAVCSVIIDDSNAVYS